MLPHSPARPPLPHWFDHAFAHAASNDQQTAARLWREEPALRQLLQWLDALSPARWKPDTCPGCDNRNIQRNGVDTRGIKRYFCPACDRHFGVTEGTPFYRLADRSHWRLYAVAVTLWGPWTPFQAWHVAGCADTKRFKDYRRRLQPLWEALDAQPLVSRPAYRLAFTPAEQGIRCLRCDSDALSYGNRSEPDNPCLKCAGCGYGFYLHASRRHLLPLPAEVRCPGCDGRHLNKKTHKPDGRFIYQCRDCRRGFIYPSKKFQPAKYGDNTHRVIPAGVSCPSCQGENLRIFAQRRDGRTVYICGDCSRYFISNPKRPPTRLKYDGLAAGSSRLYPAMAPDNAGVEDGK